MPSAAIARPARGMLMARRYHRWMRDLLALPKVELHIHLEGAMRVETALDLGRPANRQDSSMVTELM